jgi:hypothetical protein
MNDMTTCANPFLVWAELARGLRDRFLAELGQTQESSLFANQMLGKLAAMATNCDHLGISLQRLSENDARAFEAFLRALGKS